MYVNTIKGIKLFSLSRFEFGFSILTKWKRLLG
jgi:hypothetical protein